MSNRYITSSLPIAGLAATAASACALLAAITPTATANPGTGNLKCPVNYELIVTNPPHCISTSGDVVEPDAENLGFSCPKGYEWLAQLCFSPATGDVILADKDEGPRTIRVDSPVTAK